MIMYVVLKVTLLGNNRDFYTPGRDRWIQRETDEKCSVPLTHNVTRRHWLISMNLALFTFSCPVRSMLSSYCQSDTRNHGQSKWRSARILCGKMFCSRISQFMNKMSGYIRKRIWHGHLETEHNTRNGNTAVPCGHDRFSIG